jgi:hypothetical protein
MASSHKSQPRHAPGGALFDDLYDYVAAPARPARRRAKRASVTLTVTDDWLEDVPVTEAEIAVFEPGASGTRIGSAAARQHAGDHSLWRAIAGPRAFNGSRNDEGVPLICPTCQVLAQSVLAGGRLLLCMGLFSIFLVGSQSGAAWPRESFLKPRTPARPLL